MKKITQPSIFVALSFILFIFNSCTVQKRYHNKGFNIDWGFFGSDNEQPSSASNQRVKSSNNNNNESENSLPASTTASSNAKTTPKNDFNDATNVVQSSSSTHPENIDKTTHPSLSKTGSISAISNKIRDQKSDKKKQNNHYSIKAFKANKTQTQASNSGSPGTKVFGSILIIVGVLIILFVSIYGGIILVALGLIIRLIGSVSGGSNQDLPAAAQVVQTAPASQEVKKTEYVDVLYLKNGSIIRGLVMEQIPNESIKIQTADGSLFVYKMDEVLKITKELKQ